MDAPSNTANERIKLEQELHALRGRVKALEHAEIARQQSEAALRESEQRFRAIADYTYDWEHWVDPSGKLVWVNPAVERITGYTVDECLAMPTYPLPLVHPGDREKIAEAFRGAVRGRTSGNDLVFRVSHKSGRVLWAAVSWQPIYSADREWLGYRSSVRDITARKAAEDKLRQHEHELAHMARVSLLGELASGLAHELNQPLTAISSYARSAVRRIERDASDPRKLLETLEKIAGQAERAGDVIRHLRDLLHKRPTAREALDLNDAIREALVLMQHEASQSGVKIELELEDLPPILGSRIELEQVLLNLVRNGMEAMAQTPPERAKLHVATRVEEDQAVVAVRDHGVGLTEEAATRLFQPFFTTKATGMGMGLAISRTIIESHGGTLRGAAHEAGGAEFQFTIPITEERGSHVE